MYRAISDAEVLSASLDDGPGSRMFSLSTYVPAICLAMQISVFFL